MNRWNVAKCQILVALNPPRLLQMCAAAAANYTLSKKMNAQLMDLFANTSSAIYKWQVAIYILFPEGTCQQFLEFPLVIKSCLHHFYFWITSHVLINSLEEGPHLLVPKVASTLSRQGNPVFPIEPASTVIVFFCYFCSCLYCTAVAKKFYCFIESFTIF